MPNDVTVSNSSCLIALQTIGRLQILERLYGIITLPEAVANECGPGLPSWLQSRAVTDVALVKTLSLQLGAGEAEALALALEMAATRLILDDKKARRVANQLNIPITGTVAIVVRAKQAGIVTAARDVLDELMQAGFRVAPALYQFALAQVGE